MLQNYEKQKHRSKYNKGGCPYFKKHPPLLIIYELHHTHTAHSWVSHCRCWILFFLF